MRNTDTWKVNHVPIKLNLTKLMSDEKGLLFCNHICESHKYRVSKNHLTFYWWIVLFLFFKLYLVEYIMIIRFSISISRLESKFKILDKISIADPIASNHKIIVSDLFWHRSIYKVRNKFYKIVIWEIGGFTFQVPWIILW